MKIELKEITIKDLTQNYVNNQEEGVLGYSNLLNIRPKYQREFIYKDKQRDAVIETILKDFPLNTMYWVKNKDGFELLDGQQRTISICEFISGAFSIPVKNAIDGLHVARFKNLSNEDQEKILNYKLMVYICEGTEKEKLDWFQIINIAGEKLTEQELRNAIYTGPWLSDAKQHFSKTGCSAYNLGKDYVKGIPIRQDYLETAIKWINNGNIEQYMSDNQHNPNSNELWLYFQNVINWVKVVFPKYRKEMKSVNWGNLYNQYFNQNFDSLELEKEVTKLMQDDDVTKKSGIYSYVLTREEKYLNIRSFTENQKRQSYEKQEGNCIKCNNQFELSEMEADHITPWHEGGKTSSDNCQMLCKHCNRVKSGK